MHGSSAGPCARTIGTPNTAFMTKSGHSQKRFRASRKSQFNLVIFFFQAEDGIRDLIVTGVQTCALPIFGAARVRNLFAKAKKTGGIIFLDELDSIGRARTGTTPGSGGTDERESTLNALLVEMDGFGKDSNVIVIAATNRPDVLDSALLRAGRFDREVNVAPPDRKGRTMLLELYTKDRPVAEDVDF